MTTVGPPSHCFRGTDSKAKYLRYVKLSDEELAKFLVPREISDMIIRASFDPYKNHVREICKEYAHLFRWIVDVFHPRLHKRPMHIMRYCIGEIKLDKQLSTTEYGFLHLAVFKSMIKQLNWNVRGIFLNEIISAYYSLIWTCHTPAQMARFTMFVHHIFSHVDRWMTSPSARMYINAPKITDVCTVPFAVGQPLR